MKREEAKVQNERENLQGKRGRSEKANDEKMKDVKKTEKKSLEMGEVIRWGGGGEMRDF